MSPRSAWIALALLHLVPATAPACLWDRDTLEAEAKGRPEVVAVLTGRFERQPPAYYEARLTRVAAALANEPDRLDLYDDAAVACDRLHRAEEALDWLEKKRRALERVPDSPAATDHRYRYHANLGTVIAHRWLRAGAYPQTLSEMRAARDEIARALDLKPQAHFGREKYQLMAMDWILAVRRSEPAAPGARPGNARDPRCFIEFGNGANGWTSTPETRLPPALSDAVEGISGLITLGDAWQSVDVFYALQSALQVDGHSQLALLAEWRRNELEALGVPSLFSTPGLAVPFSYAGFVRDREDTARYFREARSEADAWQAARSRFIEEQVARGRHPDTHPDFWNSFAYRGRPPSLPSSPFGHWGTVAQSIGPAGGLAAALIVLWVGLRWVRSRRRQKTPPIPVAADACAPSPPSPGRGASPP